MEGIRERVDDELSTQLRLALYPDTPAASAFRDLYASVSQDTAWVRTHHELRLNPWAAGCLQLVSTYLLTSVASPAHNGYSER